MSTKKKVLLGISAFVALITIIFCSIWFGTTKQREITKEFYFGLFNPEITTDQLINKYIISGVESLVSSDDIENIKNEVNLLKNNPLIPKLEKVTINSISIETGEPAQIGGILKLRTGDSEDEFRIPFSTRVLKVGNHFNIVFFKAGLITN